MSEPIDIGDAFAIALYSSRLAALCQASTVVCIRAHAEMANDVYIRGNSYQFNILWRIDPEIAVARDSFGDIKDLAGSLLGLVQSMVEDSEDGKHVERSKIRTSPSYWYDAQADKAAYHAGLLYDKPEDVGVLTDSGYLLLMDKKSHFRDCLSIVGPKLPLYEGFDDGPVRRKGMSHGAPSADILHVDWGRKRPAAYKL